MTSPLACPLSLGADLDWAEEIAGSGLNWMIEREPPADVQRVLKPTCAAMCYELACGCCILKVAHSEPGRTRLARRNEIWGQAHSELRQWLCPVTRAGDGWLIQPRLDGVFTLGPDVLGDPARLLMVGRLTHRLRRWGLQPQFRFGQLRGAWVVVDYIDAGIYAAGQTVPAVLRDARRWLRESI